MTNSKKSCADCLVHNYQGNLHTIVTKREHYWDEVLTICCRTCLYGEYSNFCDPKLHGDVINDVVVKKIEIRLKSILGPGEYSKEKNRIMEESEWIKKI